MRVCLSDQVSEYLPTHSIMQFRVGWSDEGSFQSDKIRGYLFHESPGFWTLEYSMACTLFDGSQLRIMLSEVVCIYFPLEIGVENKDQQL